MEIAHGNFATARSEIESAADVFGEDDPGVLFLRDRLRNGLADDK